MRWIVTQVKSQFEDVAIKNLVESGFNCYCPRIIIEKGPLLEKRPMFSGYIFVEIELDDMPKWRTIKSHRGVLKILMNSDTQPALLPIGFVEAMLERGPVVQDFSDVVKFARGEKIRFTAGPFSGIEGKIQWTNKQRVSLLIELLGREMTIESAAHLIAKC